MKYKNYEVKNKSEVTELVTSGKQELIIKAIIGGVNKIEDWQWIQNVCLLLIYHSDFWIAKTAITSLSDIARINRKIEKEKVLEVLDSIDEPKLSDIVSMVKEDIELFVKTDS